MSTSQKTPRIPLPKGWKHDVRAAVLHVISVAQYATIYTRSWATPKYIVCDRDSIFDCEAFRRGG